MVDADDTVGQRLAVRELDRPGRPRVHGGLRLGVYDRGRAALGDIGGRRLLLVEGPVFGLLDSDGLHRLAVGLLLGRDEVIAVGAGVDRVRDLVELISDGSRHAGSREHDHQTDDGDNQDVLDN